jgi:NAD(P)-dependent dehydrogenase (short-subunit alcohol dehydrogenase family)
MGVARLGAYSASKGGVTALTYAWAAEVAGTGVRVNAVSPNARTPLADRLATSFPDLPLGTATPESNAAAVVCLLSEDARDINGQVFVTGGSSLGRQLRPRIAELAERAEWTPLELASAMSGRPR